MKEDARKSVLFFVARCDGNGRGGATLPNLPFQGERKDVVDSLHLISYVILKILLLNLHMCIFFCNFGHLPWLSCHCTHTATQKANSPVATLTLRSPYFSHSRFFENTATPLIELLPMHSFVSKLPPSA